MHREIQNLDDIKETISLQQKVGQLFMLAVFINDSEEEIQKTEKLIHDHHIGALCFFHSRASAATNFEGKKEVVYNERSLDRLKELITRYQKASKVPLLVAMDAEWGLAMRIENTPQYPYAITLGALQDGNDLIYEVGRNIGLDCKEAGVHWNLAPVVDINNNPENPVIGYRSFGDQKEEVRTKAAAFLSGMKDAGILNSLKHFPGHGDTNIDSHLGLPVIDKSEEKLFQNELFPFKELIKKEVDSVMVAHLSLPQLDDSGNPSTTSKAVITGLLREKMGFEGVIISDALNMHAVSKMYPEKGALEAAAFEGGMDMLCFSENPVEGINKILNASSPTRIETSIDRVWKLKEKIFEPSSSGENERNFSCSEINKKIAQNCITKLHPRKNNQASSKHDTFLNLSVGNPKENSFSTGLEKEYGQVHHDISLESINHVLALAEDSQDVVLALFPPSSKPKSQFGFKPEMVRVIQNLLSQNQVTLYLFGNPYVIDIFEDTGNSNIVLVYQDFPEFQEVALQHFLGHMSANGRLPVQLKTVSP